MLTIITATTTETYPCRTPPVLVLPGTTAGNVLYTRMASSEPSSRENKTRNRSLRHEIVPPLPTVPFGKTPLLRSISSAYVDTSHGNSHIMYATSSPGKTTACQAFMQNQLPKTQHSRGLMITFTSSDNYLTHSLGYSVGCR
jgi:hypothetical protein